MTFIPHRPVIYGPHRWICHHHCEDEAIYRITCGSRTDWWFYSCAAHLEQAMRAQLSWQGPCLVSPAWAESILDVVRSKARVDLRYNPLEVEGWFPDDKPASWSALTIPEPPTTVPRNASSRPSASVLASVRRWFKH